ncbi:MAG: hypothetical protein WBF03_03120 [Xanthobacteraceae bacterium]
MVGVAKPATRANADALKFFPGGYGILGPDKVALADAGLQNMTIITGANGDVRLGLGEPRCPACRRTNL